jgi:hypothetical protein
MLLRSERSMTDGTCIRTTEERCTILRAALLGYRAKVSPHYDETLWEIMARVEDTHSLGKADLGALFLWKRIPRGSWAKSLLSMPDTEIRRVTAVAVKAALDDGVSVPIAAGAARAALVTLHGMRSGDAFASAAILAAAPHRMAVYDRRARIGLQRVCLFLTNEPGRYARYMELVEQCREEMDAQHGDLAPLSARDVDTALSWLGGNESAQ